ncbi:hypothetical protein ACFX12_001095 [Malus domestica]
MEGTAAKRLRLVFALVLLTFLAANQHRLQSTVVVEGSRPSITNQESPSPSPDVASCHPHGCEASCRAELEEEYISFHCVSLGEETSCVCFSKYTIISASNRVVYRSKSQYDGKKAT